MKKSFSRALSLLLCLAALFLLTAPLAACGEAPGPVTQNAITSVSIKTGGRKGTTVTVTGVLTEDFLKNSTGSVYLFELTPGNERNTDLSELTPVASDKAAKRITFSLPLTVGTRTRVFSSFVIAAKEKAGTYTALTAPAAVTDVDKLSGTRAASADKQPDRSIKGLVSSSPVDALTTGISHAVVTVRMDELIRDGWEEGRESYVWNGTSAYVDGKALAALDRTVSAYTAVGVHVYLQFVLGGSTLCPRVLYAASVADGTGVVNMNDPEAADVMAGFLDFMAARYAAADSPVGRGLCDTFIMGRNVNSTPAAARPGGGTLSDVVANYEKLVRMTDVALRLHNPAARACLALDSRLTDTADGWGIPAFLSAFASEAAVRGAYDWQVSCEMYAPGPKIWVTDADVDGTRLTIHSLSLVTDLLSGDRYKDSDGNSRRLVINRFDVPSVNAQKQQDEPSQAASVAYAYYACVANGSVDALALGTYAAADDPTGAGLCAVRKGADGTFTLTPRAACDVFRMIDTTEADSTVKAVGTLIGSAFTDLQNPMIGVPRPVRRLSGTATDDERTVRTGTILYTFDEGSDCGFEDAGGLVHADLSRAEALEKPVYTAVFHRDTVGSPMGLIKTEDAATLIGGKMLRINLYAGPVGKTDTGTSLTLRLTRAAKGSAASGDGTIIWETPVTDLRPGTWQTAAFDISGFTERLDPKDTVTITLLINGQDGTDYEMGIEAVTITGTSSFGPPPALVAIVVTASILIVAGVLVFLSLKKRFG